MALEGWVYIMASRNRVLYVGVTRDLFRRWKLHRAREGAEFVAKYQVNRLVYIERADQLTDALRREKQLKRWRRSKKIALIEATNPGWQDLAIVWGWLKSEE
jgi:putative endonuclease